MTAAYNIYCDESCHLENDGKPIMVLGALWCPIDRARGIAEAIREIKKRHGLNSSLELKWGKVSPFKKALYIELVNYFLDEPALNFRGLIAEKTGLQHAQHAQDHDTWYYKMYFLLLRHLLRKENQYRIYLDIKDTKSAAKLEKLKEVLSNNMWDFNQVAIERLQSVRSSEVEQIQLCDLLVGAVSYASRRLSTSAPKLELVELLRQRTGTTLESTTLYRTAKFNLFRWKPQS